MGFTPASPVGSHPPNHQNRALSTTPRPRAFSLQLPKGAPLYLARGREGQAFQELHGPRVFVGRKLRLHEILKLLDQRILRLWSIGMPAS